LLRELEAGGDELGDDRVGGQLVGVRRADGEIALLEIDDGDAASGFEPGGELREVVQAIVDVVPRVDDEHEVDARGRKLGIVGGRERRNDVRQLRLCRALFHVVNQLGLDVDRQHAPLFTHRLGQANGEVPGAGAQIGDRHSRRDPERRQHGLGLLPGVPRRVVENADPLLDVVERMPDRGVVSVPTGFGECCEQRGDREHGGPSIPFETGC